MIILKMKTSVFKPFEFELFVCKISCYYMYNICTIYVQYYNIVLDKGGNDNG